MAGEVMETGWRSNGWNEEVSVTKLVRRRGMPLALSLYSEVRERRSKS